MASVRQKRDYDNRIVETVYVTGGFVYKKCAPAKKLEKMCRRTLHVFLKYCPRHVSDSGSQTYTC